MAMAAFRRHYRDHLFDTTTTYPGVFETLRYFERIPKAVVTNKPVEFAREVLQRLLSPFFVAVVGGDSLPRKPSPDLCSRRPGCASLTGRVPGDQRCGRYHLARQPACRRAASLEGLERRYYRAGQN